MFFEGLKPVKLGSLQDRIRLGIYYRQEQTRLFEALLNVFSIAGQSNPDLRPHVGKMLEDYIDIRMPGAKAAKETDNTSLIQKQAQALDSIYGKLKEHANRKEGDTNANVLNKHE